MRPRWILAPNRITWFPHLAVGFLLIIVLLPWDETISRLLRFDHLSGETLRALDAAQQYWLVVSLLLLAAVIWLQDPARRQSLADWVAALVVTGILAMALKMFLGRPRPVLDEPEIFLGPLGAYPLGPDAGIRHAWEIGTGVSTTLWSMPSSQTAFVAVAAVFIAFTYRRLRYLAFAVLALAALLPVQTGGHYFTDVIAGVALGLAVGQTVMTFRWGQRALDAIKALSVRPNSVPPARTDVPAEPDAEETVPAQSLRPTATSNRG